MQHALKRIANGGFMGRIIQLLRKSAMKGMLFYAEPMAYAILLLWIILTITGL